MGNTKSTILDEKKLLLSMKKKYFQFYKYRHFGKKNKSLDEFQSKFKSWKQKNQLTKWKYLKTNAQKQVIALDMDKKIYSHYPDELYIPDEIYDFIHLESLRISCHVNPYLSPRINRLTKLNILVLNNNFIETIPKELYELTQLEILSLGFCHLVKDLQQECSIYHDYMVEHIRLLFFVEVRLINDLLVLP